MKIQIEASEQQFKDLLTAIHDNTELKDIQQQVVTGLSMANHDQEDDVPKVGDDPIIDRFE